MLVGARFFWRVCLGVACSAALGLSTPRAAAQSDAADKAAAEALFDEGLELLKNGEYEQSCRKLESSQRVDPGIGTLLYLAECYEKSGRHASAWATFREASSMADAAGQEERAAVGARRAKRLEPKLSRLTIQVNPELQEIEQATILYGEREIPRSLWGTSIPVDPGPHALRVTAPGYHPYEETVTVDGDGTEKTIDVPALVADPERPAEAGSPDPPEVGAVPPSVPIQAADRAPEGGDTQRMVGMALGGAGLLGLGVGTVAGIIAINKNDQALESGCSGTICPIGEGESLTNQALTAATVADVGLIAGGVLLAGGVVLYLTAPEDTEVARVSIQPTFAGAQVMYGGKF